MSFLRKLQTAARSSESVLPSTITYSNTSALPGGNDQEVPSMCNCSNIFEHKGNDENIVTTTLVPYSNSDFDAFLYIVVVLLFYAFVIILLMVKYIRGENEEAIWDDMFVDFVKREQYLKPYQQIDHRTDKMYGYVVDKLKVFNQKRGIPDDLQPTGPLIYYETSV